MSGQFGGKKAAPFVKGGGRKKSHPRDARGRLKVAVRRAKGKDLSNIDLSWAKWDAAHPWPGHKARGGSTAKRGKAKAALHKFFKEDYQPPQKDQFKGSNFHRRLEHPDEIPDLTPAEKAAARRASMIQHDQMMNERDRESLSPAKKGKPGDWEANFGKPGTHFDKKGHLHEVRPSKEELRRAKIATKERAKVRKEKDRNARKAAKAKPGSAAAYAALGRRYSV